MELLTALRFMTIGAWLVVFGAMLPAVYALLFTRTARYGDPARGVVAGFALLIILFTGRWLVAPQDSRLHAALYAFSIVWAAFTLLAARSYGRGGPSA